MTDPVITIAPTEVSVEPGGQARVEITVRNPSAIVEGYRIEVLGETPGVGPSVWAQVHPAELRIYPQEKVNAILVLAPPADVTVGQSGRFPFAVRAVSTVTDGVSAVAEGDVEVGRMFGLQATITPITSTGRWRGHHLIKYTNWGNAPVRLRIAAHDPDQRLGFLLRVSELELSLGASAETRLTVRTRKPSLRGTQQRLAFEVVGESDQPGAPRPPGPSLPGDPRRPVLTAAFLQKPILSRATVAIAGLAVAAVAAAIVIAVRRPTPAPTFESEGLPLPPAAVVAAAQKDGSIQVSWKVVRNVQGYKVIRSKNGIPDSVSQVAPEQLAFSATGLDPRTKYCFTVETFRGAKLTSDVSGAACAVTLPVAGSGGPSGSGASSPGAGGGPGGPGGSGSAGASGWVPGGPSGASTGAGSSSPSAPTSATSTAPADKYGPDDWILIVGRLFDEQSDATAAQDAAALANSLRTQGIAATVLHSTDFPKLGIGLGVKHPFYAAYLAGPFSQTEATDRALTYRSETGLVVSPVQPNPAQ